MQQTHFSIGDTLSVAVTVREGPKTAVRRFKGVVLSRRRGASSETVTVRRVVNGEGVERTFPLKSPTVVGVDVIRGAKVRRAKLYFLRERRGKAARLPRRPGGAPAKGRRRRRGAKAKAERRARRAREQRPPPEAGSAGVFARLRPTDPPRVPPSPRRARQDSPD